jgi:hypothetical protein
MLLLSPAAAGATTRDDLLQLVPEDTALCVVINNLRPQSQKLADCAWVKRIEKSVLGKTMLDSPELKQVFRLDGELERHLDINWQQLRDDILGDCVVFASQRNAANPNDEKLLILLWARNDELLSRLLKSINQAQLQSGEVKEVQKRSYKDWTIYRRAENKGDRFYFQSGSLFVFSTNEALLRQVLDRQKLPRPTSPSVVVQSFQRLRHKNALLTVWVNPRAFDAEIRQKAATADEDGAQVQKNFLRYWQALDALAASVVVQPDPELLLSLQGRPDALPDSARRFLQVAAAPSDLLNRFPRTTIVTLTCRIDFAAALTMAEDFMTPKARKEMHASLQKTLGPMLGMNFVHEVLPYLGPDIGFYLAPAADPKALPHLLLAMRVQPGPKEAHVDEAIWNALNFYLGSIVLANNLKSKDRLRIRTVTRDKNEVKYLEHQKFPPGFQPAFALKDGYLLAASTPDAIQRFEPAGIPSPPQPVLLRVSLDQLQQLLRQQQPWLVPAMLQKNQLTEKAAKQLLQDTLSGLDLFDRVEIDQYLTQGQVTWRLRLLAARAKPDK